MPYLQYLLYHCNTHPPSLVASADLVGVEPEAVAEEVSRGALILR